MQFDDKQATFLEHGTILPNELQFGALDITDQLEATQGELLVDLPKCRGLGMNRPESQGMLIPFPRAEGASRDDEIGMGAAIVTQRVGNGPR
jgi:hypothetical protein